MHKVILALACSQLVFAGTLTFSSSCSIDDNQNHFVSVPGNPDCAISTPFGSQSSITLTAIFGTTSGDVQATAVARDFLPDRSTSSNLSASYSDWVYTDGPKRTGIGYLTISGHSLAIEGIARIGVGIQGLGGGCVGYDNCSIQSPWPVTLGIPFQVILILQLQAATDSISPGDPTTQAFLHYSFRFTELDGTTPVDILAAPEPSSLGLGILGCLIMLTFAKRKHIGALHRQGFPTRHLPELTLSFTKNPTLTKWNRG